MLMAQGLVRHMLGRDWRMPWDPDRARECPELCSLLLWFADVPGPRCLFSIHNMVQVGMGYDKLPGEWYGPSTSAYVLRDLALVRAVMVVAAPINPVSPDH
jgi:cysteine protease ATG4